MKINWKFVLAFIIIMIIGSINEHYLKMIRNENVKNFELRQFRKLNIDIDSLLLEHSTEDYYLKKDERYIGKVKLLYVDSFNHGLEALIAFNIKEGYKIIGYDKRLIFPYVGDSIYCLESFNCYLKRAEEIKAPY